MSQWLDLYLLGYCDLSNTCAEKWQAYVMATMSLWRCVRDNAQHRFLQSTSVLAQTQICRTPIFKIHITENKSCIGLQRVRNYYQFTCVVWRSIVDAVTNIVLIARRSAFRWWCGLDAAKQSCIYSFAKQTNPFDGCITQNTHEMFNKYIVNRLVDNLFIVVSYWVFVLPASVKPIRVSTNPCTYCLWNKNAF